MIPTYPSSNIVKILATVTIACRTISNITFALLTVSLIQHHRFKLASYHSHDIFSLPYQRIYIRSSYRLFSINAPSDIFSPSYLHLHHSTIPTRIAKICQSTWSIALTVTVHRGIFKVAANEIIITQTNE